ncbi:hypothetical protein [Candidatus Mycoplasma haematohominis]|uniref:hypothetical protein n=1 Tax=Candidatus Mycoplasma haematohominis TaxID=1494318 RepID=UPI001C0A6B2F|nr:hypothetical protein [Candidatus Mycoplasma haemohominis]
MRIFDYFFNRYGIPLLVVGSTGTGIKLYFGKVGYLTSGNSEIFSSLEELENLNNFQADDPNTQPSLPPKPKVNTFSDQIDKQKFTLFTESTTEEVIRNVMFQRLYPNKDDGFTYGKDQLFKGGVSFKFKEKTFNSKDGTKHLKTIEKPDSTEVNKFKEACLKALQTEYTEANGGSDQVARLREWCTEPKVKDVLGRHKFHVFSDDKYKAKADENIKKIIFGWFKEDGNHKWWEKQSFLSENEIQQILNGKSNGFKEESEITPENIKIVKDKCLVELDKKFERENFYLTKDFVDQMADQPSPKPKVDAFQEVALFCSEPTTAEDYVRDAMQGNFKADFEDKDKKDYCYFDNKQITDYKKVSTTDPFEGKTFWCAVRLLYETKNPPNNKH